MDKESYTIIVKEWLENFLKKKYSRDNDIEVIIPTSNISKLSNDSIKKIKNYSLMDFSPDVIGIIKSKIKEEVNLVLLNKSINPISVKEIGEMNLYSKILEPEIAFIVSSKGLPNEVNSLLLNDETELSLLNYAKDKSIIILRLTEDSLVDKKTIFPRKFKNLF